MAPTFKNISGIFLLTLIAYFSWLMWKKIVLYISLKPGAGFLQLKQIYLHIDIWRIAFYMHVFTSLLALLAGFTQFSTSFLKTGPILPRKIGYVYVLNILFITGPAGLMMSFYANGGITARIGFIMLSIWWTYFTAMALYKAIKKEFAIHRAFMIRSYALTLSAISLRGWKAIIATFSNLGPDERYKMIAWLGWGLNLLIAEIIIR